MISIFNRIVWYILVILVLAGFIAFIYYERTITSKDNRIVELENQIDQLSVARDSLIVGGDTVFVDVPVTVRDTMLVEVPVIVTITDTIYDSCLVYSLELDTTITDLADLHIWAEVITIDPPAGQIGLAVTNRIIKYRTLTIEKFKYPRWGLEGGVLMGDNEIIPYAGVSLGLFRTWTVAHSIGIGATIAENPSVLMTWRISVLR